MWLVMVKMIIVDIIVLALCAYGVYRFLRYQEHE